MLQTNLLRLCLLCVSVTIMGCGTDDEPSAVPTGDDVFRALIPSRELVIMTVAGLAVLPPYGQGEGEPSIYYNVLRHSTRDSNNVTVPVMDMINEIAKQKPTTTDRSKAIWTTDEDAISPIIWRLTIEKKSDLASSWTLETRPRSSSATALEVYASGTHNAAEAALEPKNRTGYGAFVINANWFSSIPAFGFGKGDTFRSSVVYAQQNKAGIRTVGLDRIAHIADESTYHRFVLRYSVMPTGAGELESFSEDGNGAAPSIEGTSGYKYRWLETGAGRMDLIDNGNPDITASTCWDAESLNTYEIAGPFLFYGEEASDCVFVPAAYARP